MIPIKRHNVKIHEKKKSITPEILLFSKKTLSGNRSA
jgi:hypothetical protein